jgi:hypothetical protein
MVLTGHGTQFVESSAGRNVPGLHSALEKKTTTSQKKRQNELDPTTSSKKR